MPDLKTVTIFIASSAELKEERNAFRLFVADLNDKFVDRHVYLKIIKWEKFLDAISNTRLQDEYNAALQQSDLALCLFFTKVGKYTEEEFDTAYETFKASGKPKIWTYFKNAPVTIGSLSEADINSLFKFRKKLSDLGHFYTTYESTADLHNQFRSQLDHILPELILPINDDFGKRSTPSNPSTELGLHPEVTVPTPSALQNSGGIEEIEELMDDPTEENIKAVINKLSALTRNTRFAGFMPAIRADLIQYKQDKLFGINMNGRFNFLLKRILDLIDEYKKSNE